MEDEGAREGRNGERGVVGWMGGMEGVHEDSGDPTNVWICKQCKGLSSVYFIS